MTNESKKEIDRINKISIMKRPVVRLSNFSNRYTKFHMKQARQ